MRKALAGCDMATALDIDFDPNGYVLYCDDIVAVAKAIRDFAKTKGNEALVVNGVIPDGQVLSKEYGVS